MATRADLRSRWQTPLGAQVEEEVDAFLRSTGPEKARAWAFPAALQERLREMPYAAEVADGLDLRGATLLWPKYLDLRGARLDHAEIVGGIAHCRVEDAIFDHVHAVNASFNDDFCGVSFAGAFLHGASFTRAELVGATFTKAKLQCATLQGVNCRRAIFVGADLRLAHCPSAIFCEADFTAADLRGANLAKIAFDEKSTFSSADLSHASLSDDLRQYVGLATKPNIVDLDYYTLATFDSLVYFLEQDQEQPLFREWAACLKSLRPQLVADSQFDWASPLKARMTEAEWSTFESMTIEGFTNISNFFYQQDAQLVEH